MTKRELGRSGVKVNAVGLGCMGMSEFYGPATERDTAVRFIHEAIAHGVDHLDTAEMYGMGHNEELLGAALQGGYRDKVFLATKFGPMRDPETGRINGVDGSPENCRRAIEGSLKRLNTDVVDLYYLHRIDPATPIEDTVGEMAKLVAEGKVRFLGLSEASGETLKRANAVHPITAVQSEYSIFSRDIEAKLMPGLRETGASLVAYSPLGRGMLTGRFTRETAAEVLDYRSNSPRFQGEAFEANLALVDEVKSVAGARGATPAQVALAWVLGRGEDIVTIPGTTKLANLDANLGALEVSLSDEERAKLDALAEKVQGLRYPEPQMALTNA